MRVSAFCLAERIDLRSLQGERLSPGALELDVGGHGRVIVFRFGSVVMIGVDADDEQLALQRLAKVATEPHSQVEREETELLVGGDGDGVTERGIVLRELERPHIEVVADVLAKSVALARYEARMTQVFSEVEPLAQRIHATGRAGRRTAGLVRQIGASLLMEHAMVGRIAVGDAPDIIWDRRDLSRLYDALVDEYELRDRCRALEQKLALVQRTTHTLLDLVQEKRMLHLEFYILIVIVIEMTIMAYELASRVS